MIYEPSHVMAMSDEERLKAVVAKAIADREACAKDPWEAVKRGWVFTLDERAAARNLPSVRPMPPLEYLEVLTRLWMECDRGIVFKSRQMMASWLYAYLNLWMAMNHVGQHCIIQGKRVEDVDAKTPHNILGRARFIREHLPAPIAPEVVAEVVSENITSETYKNSSTLEAIPEGAHIVRGKVPSSHLMDEGEFQETGEDNWNASNPSASKLWMVSTPNGHGFGYKQNEQDRPWDNWRDWPQIIPGVHSYKNSRGIQLVFVHFTADPANRTPEAQEKRRNGYTNVNAYLREQEGDFSLHDGDPVWKEFMPATHVIPKYIPDPTLPIHCGWDFGYNGAAVSFMQHNLFGQLVHFDQILLKQVPLQRVILEVKKRITMWMGRAYEDSRALLGMAAEKAVVEPAVFHYGDPSADSKNSRGESDEMLLSQFGIRLKMKETTGRKRELVEQVRTLLLPRSDRRPGMIVARNSAEMDMIIAMYGGGYHYARNIEGKATSESPKKDGYYDHPADSIQYLVDNVSPIRWAHANEDFLIPGEWYDAEVGVGHPSYNN